MAIKTFDLSLISNEAFSIADIDRLLNEGWQVIGHSSYLHINEPEPFERWTLHKPDGVPQNTAKPLPQNTQVLNIESIECRETFSKSTNQYFKFWSCVDKFGAKVNIFDHPDTNRNTFNILKAADWGHWAEMAVGETKELDTPLPMLVSHDGEWASLVSVTSRYSYIALCEYYDGMLDEADDLGMDDIPFPRAASGLFIDGDYIPTNEGKPKTPYQVKISQMTDDALKKEHDDNVYYERLYGKQVITVEDERRFFKYSDQLNATTSELEKRSAKTESPDATVNDDDERESPLSLDLYGDDELEGDE